MGLADFQTELTILVSVGAVMGGVGGAIKYIQNLIKAENKVFTDLVKELQEGMKAMDLRINELPLRFVTKDDHRSDIQDLRNDIRELRVDNARDSATITSRLDQLLNRGQVHG